MKKIAFTFISLLIFSASSFSQRKMHDKSARYFYNYILDSISDYQHVKLIDNILYVNAYTINYPISKLNRTSKEGSKINILTKVFNRLKTDFDIDSSEIYNLKNYRRKLSLTIFNQKKYTIKLTDENTKNQVSFSEPIYFYDKKFVIVVFASGGGEGLYLFHKKYNKWVFHSTVDETFF